MSVLGMTMTYLAALSVIDAKRREIPVWILIAGSLGAGAFAVWRVMIGGVSLEGLLFGAVPGMILLALAALTKGTGFGDGIVMLQMSLLLLLERVVFAFSISLILMGVFSILLLVLKKGNKDTRLPYLPFLWVGCLCSICLCGVV